MYDVIVNDIEEYLELIDEYKGDCYFRGQANTSWRITPSLFRNHFNLNNEYKDVNEVYVADDHKRILFKILEMQHYQKPTRLCDLTVNPLVALFFALDDKNEISQDGCVYVLEGLAKMPIDSIEVKIMTKLASSNIKTIDRLKQEIISDFGIDIDESRVKEIIFRNYILEYGLEFAFSNPRAHLQGGTAIYFGFSTVDGVSIERKNEYDVEGIIRKIIIPTSRKEYFRNELSNRGITSETLYDKVFEYRMTSRNPIKYDVIIDSISNRFDFTKVVLWIQVKDNRVIYDDILSPANDVFAQMKATYGPATRIFMIVFYDEQDKKACNFICHVNPTKDFSGFTIKWNNDYQKRRLEYFHEQISSKEIIARMEPIISTFLTEWKKVKKSNTMLREALVDRSEYKALLSESKKKLHRIAYWDSQDIAAGGDNGFRSIA